MRQRARQEARIVQPSPTSVCTSANIMALSESVLIWIQAGCTDAVPSLRTGLTLMTSTAAAASARNESAVECAARPSFATWVFFGFDRRTSPGARRSGSDACEWP
jgi:hypothetical protein